MASPRNKTTLTEPALIGMLRERYCKPGNGGSGEYALLTHVRDDSGFDATTTIDALALGLWPSRGHLLHGFEIKCSRADWLRELGNPAKAEKTAARCDMFWLVTASPDIVQPGELPPTWGHLTVRGGRLAVAVAAPDLGRTPEQRLVDRRWLVCLLRAAGAPGTRREDDSETERIRREGYQAGLDSAADSVKRAVEERERLAAGLAEERQRRRDFFTASGLPAPAEWNLDADLTRIAEVVRAVVEGDRTAAGTEGVLSHVLGIIEVQRGQLKRALDDLARTRGNANGDRS